jgi:hypothetical protein
MTATAMTASPAPVGAPAADSPVAVDDPALPVWPGTVLSPAEIVDRGAQLPVSRLGGHRGRRGVERILAGLHHYPGRTWQQRWAAAGCDAAGGDWVRALGDPWRGLADSTRENESLAGVAVLLCLDVVRPSYAWMHQVRLLKTYDTLLCLRDPQFTARAGRHTQQAGHPARLLDRALLAIGKIMAGTGKTPAQITPDDVLDYRAATLRQRRNAVGVDYAWQLLTDVGGFPPDTPPLWQALRGRPPSVPDIVDSYTIACQPVRDLLVRYLTERAPELDYKSLRTTAWKLCGVFWKDLEEHHPGINSLHLPADVVEGWKLRLHDDSVRTDPWPVLTAVRSFYLDIAHWATTDAYWAAWAAPCPIRAADSRGVRKHRKRVVARMHQKVRSLAPLMPAVLRAIDAHLDHETALLAAGPASPGRAAVHLPRPAVRTPAPAVPARRALPRLRTVTVGAVGEHDHGRPVGWPECRSALVAGREGRRRGVGVEPCGREQRAQRCGGHPRCHRMTPGVAGGGVPDAGH